MKRTGKDYRDSSAKTIKRSMKRTTLIFAILVLLCLIGIGLVILFVNKATGLDIEGNTYQYCVSSRVDYYDPIHLSNSEISTMITDNKEEVSDCTPIYTKDDNSLYLPISYSYADVSDNTYWRIPEFMKLTKNASNNIVTCTYNEDYYEIAGGFLFDGRNQYIFLEDGIITVDDIEYEVAPFSFFSGDLDYGISRIYNQTTKEFVYFEDEITTANYVSKSGYSINLIRGIYTHKDKYSELLIADPSLLHSIGDR